MSEANRIGGARVFEPGRYEQLSSAKRILTRDEGSVLHGRIKQEEVDAEQSNALCFRASCGNVQP